MQSPESSTASSTVAVSSRACQNCSRAKAKCVPQSGQQQCTRCFRLKKECIVLPKSTRKRRSPNTAKNTAQLEQKIESLVTLLSATQTILPTHLAVDKQPDVQSFPEKDGQEDLTRPDHRPAVCWNTEFSLNDSTKTVSWNSPRVSKQFPAPFSTATHASFPLEPTSAPSIDLQVKDPDYLLKIFREQYEVDFPFIIMPPNITSQELRARRPWLAITIFMVASHGNRLQQLALAKQIIMEVAAALFIRSEKSLDMLEGLIIYSMWQYFYAPLHPQYQSSAIIQFVLAVLFDLGLNKPLRENDGPEVIQDTFRIAADNTKEVRRPSQERRAFLICFMITNSLSSGLKRIDGLEHTPYFENSCQSLFEEAEFESDLILVFVARSEALVASIIRNNTNWVLGSADIKAPVLMQAKSAKADLQSYFMALPPHLQEHSSVRRSYHSAESFFYESSLNRSMFPGNLNSQRLDMLYACLMSSKSFLDVFLNLPISLCISMSTVTLSQLGHAITTLFKLSFIEVPGWDLAHVRETVDIGHYFEQLVSRFEQVGAEVDSSQAVPAKRSFCTGAALALGRVRAWYVAVIAADVDKGEQEDQTGLTGVEDLLSGEKFDYFDDAYPMGDWKWDEFMGDFMQE